MRIISSDVIVSVANSKMIKNDYEEIAFVGRSNVGKSSLINFLCNRKTLAKMQQQTQEEYMIDRWNEYNDANNQYWFAGKTPWECAMERGAHH